MTVLRSAQGLEAPRRAPGTATYGVIHVTLVARALAMTRSVSDVISTGKRWIRPNVRSAAQESSQDCDGRSLVSTVGGRAAFQAAKAEESERVRCHRPAASPTTP